MSKCFFTVVAVAVSAIGLGSQAATSASLGRVLAAAISYIEGHANTVDAFVVEEAYTQHAEPAQWMFSLPRALDPPVQRSEERRLKSDLFVAWDPERGLIQWRDVNEVDGREVRDDRGSMDALEQRDWPRLRLQAQQMTLSASRFNLNPERMTLDRTLNLPMAYVAFLRPAKQEGLEFSLDGERYIHGSAGQVVRFRQRTQVRTGRASSTAAAEGTLVIDPATGAVLATNIDLAETRAGVVVRAHLKMTFRPEPGNAIWVPEAMTEHYDILNADGALMGTIAGHATYSHVRWFKAKGQNKAVVPRT
jgi:hypothetical protein